MVVLQSSRVSEPSREPAIVGPGGLAVAASRIIAISQALAGVGRAVQGSGLKALDTSLRVLTPRLPVRYRRGCQKPVQRNPMKIWLGAACAALLAIHPALSQSCPYNPPQTVHNGWAPPMPISKRPMLSCNRRVVSTQPREYIGEVFFNSASGEGYPPNIWNTIDITAVSGGVIPRNATSAVLSGIAIITNATAGGGTQFGIAYADLHAAFRAPGDTSVSLDCNYAIQTLTALANEGMRSGVSVRVPLVDGKVEMAWRGTNFNGIGQPPYYALNLTVQEYCEPE